MNDRLKLLALMAREAHWVGYTVRDIRQVGRVLGLSEAEINNAAHGLVSDGLVLLVGNGRYRMRPAGISSALRAIAAGNVEDQALTENSWDLLVVYADSRLNYLVSHLNGTYTFLANDPDISVQGAGVQTISRERVRKLLSDPDSVYRQVGTLSRASALATLYRNDSRISEMGLGETAA